MDTKSLEKLFLASGATLILIPIAAIIFFIVRSRANKNIAKLEVLYSEIDELYAKNSSLKEFNVISSFNSEEDLYISYDKILLTESILRYTIDKKNEAKELISELKSLMLYSNSSIFNNNWKQFFDADPVEIQLLNNINKEKQAIYLKFKEFSYA